MQRCLGTLTELQRESITLAYFSGYTYREVADLLTAPLPTIKTRLRDGLIRLRDCLGGDLVTTPDMHLDTGALALGALPPDELPAAAAHVEGCDTCREELAGFRETVVRLAAVAAQAPPASLRRSVLAAVAVTPQLPPIGGSAGGAGRADRPAAPSRPGPGTPRRSPVPRRPVPSRPTVSRRPALGRPAGQRPVPAPLVPAAGRLAGRGRGGGRARWRAGRARPVPRARAGRPDPAAVRRRGCRPHPADPGERPGRGGLRPSCAAVTVDVSGLPALPDDRTYQLWALSGEPSTAPRSLGLLPAAATGAPQTVTEPTRPGEVAVAITAEPAGGRPRRRCPSSGPPS